MTIQAGETVSLIGPSGCGKTTLLHVISGVVPLDKGSVRISTPVQRSLSIGLMMQDSLLLPWRTLEGNALLGAEVLHRSSAALTEECRKLFGELSLAECSRIYPEAASGGMARRVALIRTLLCEPRFLLLDEPFTGLDYDIKLRTQEAILARQRINGFGMILVTHDIEDAIALADRILILSDKPARIKGEISIEIDDARHDPIAARKSPRFRDYFSQVWDQLQYLDPKPQSSPM